MTASSTTAYSNTLAPCGNDGVIAIPFLITVSGAVANADTVNLCKIPVGYKVSLLNINTDKAIGSGTGTLKVGFNDGTTNDDDLCLVSTAATAAVAKTVPPAVADTYAVAEATIFLTAGLASGASSDITYSGCVIATPFKA